MAPLNKKTPSFNKQPKPVAETIRFIRREAKKLALQVGKSKLSQYLHEASER